MVKGPVGCLENEVLFGANKTHYTNDYFLMT